METPALVARWLLVILLGALVADAIYRLAVVARFRETLRRWDT